MLHLVCENPIEVHFADYVSEDPERRDRARAAVKLWAHLAKMGYVIE